MSGIPEWLKEHRELQYLRAAASSTKRPRRGKREKKKRKNHAGEEYVDLRYRKLKEGEEGC